MKHYAHVLALSWCLLPALSIAAESETKPNASIASGSNSGDTNLRLLLREVGARTHKHFVVDPRAPQLIDLGGIDQNGISYPQLLSVLQIYGFVVVADDSVMQVLPNTDVRQAALPLIAPDSIKTLDDEVIISVIPLKNINAAQLVPIFRPMIPQYGHLAAIVDRNALIIIDRTASVRRIVEIIKELERLPKAVDSQPPKAP